MKLLPYDRFSLETKQALSTIIARLDTHIEAPKLRLRIPRNHAPYVGTLSNSGFEIRRIIHYRNSFLPRIRGQFESSPQGTIVHITLRLHPLVIAFLLFWFSVWYGASIPIFLTGMVSGDIQIEMGLVLGFPLVILLGFWGAFWYEANRSRRELTHIIQGTPLISSASSRNRWRIVKGIAWMICVANLVVLIHQQIIVPQETSQAPTVEPCTQNLSPSPYCDFSLLRTVTGHPTATAIALTNDGKTLVSGGRDKAIKVWDLQTGALKRTLQSDSGIITALAIAPDGNTIVSGGGDRMVRIWDATTDQRPQMLPGHVSQNVYPVKISEDGTTIISGGYNEIKLWDRATGALKTTLPEAARPISIGPVTLEAGPNQLRFFDISADGKTALVELGSKLILWNLFTQQQTELPHPWFTHVNAAYLSPDSQTMVATSYTQPKTYLNIWDTVTGKLKAKILLSSARESWGYGDRIALSPDRVMVSTPTGLKIWNLQTAELEAVLAPGPMHHLMVSPDAKRLIGITGDAYAETAQIQIWQRP